MAVTSIAFGYMMSILGIILYGASVARQMYGTEFDDPAPGGNPWLRPLTALIPAAFGIGLIVCGTIASRTRSDRTRMHVMHAAVLLGLVGAVIPFIRLVIGAAHGKKFWELAMTGNLVMSLLSTVFVVLCVRSFIEARRARQQKEAEAVK